MWPPELLTQYLKHPYRNVELDPVLKGISHYRSADDDKHLELFVQLARYNSSSGEKSCGFWVPWACVMRNPNWVGKLNNRWCPKEIKQRLQKTQGSKNEIPQRPRRLYTTNMNALQSL